MGWHRSGASIATASPHRALRPSPTGQSRDARLRGPRRGKRLLDATLAAVGLVGSSPLWLLIAAAIKLQDGGPVLFEQIRTGQHGRRFRLLKFRSMIPEAERVTGAVLSAANDPRITPVGRVLRATALDELPQLVNILRGDMSFVGPRPERPEFVERFRHEIRGYERRLVERPGLTGLAQIYGRYDSEPRCKLRYDLLYVRRCSVPLDLKLIALSFWITFRGRWQHDGAKL
jgi:lipopolysaccharide/colanic/teichoic acid biosynthesis glycosyltransferase